MYAYKYKGLYNICMLNNRVEIKLDRKCKNTNMRSWRSMDIRRWTSVFPLLAVYAGSTHPPLWENNIKRWNWTAQWNTGCTYGVSHSQKYLWRCCISAGRYRKTVPVYFYCFFYCLPALLNCFWSRLTLKLPWPVARRAVCDESWFWWHHCRCFLFDACLCCVVCWPVSCCPATHQLLVSAVPRVCFC